MLLSGKYFWPHLGFCWPPLTKNPGYASDKDVDDCTAYEVVSRSTNYTMLQTDLNIVNTWTETNNMRLNIKKTKEFRIYFLKIPSAIDQLTINNISLDIVQNFKLLGITISSDLTWNIHVDNICAKAIVKGYMPFEFGNEMVSRLQTY
jgi:hypothetical protein